CARVKHRNRPSSPRSTRSTCASASEPYAASKSAKSAVVSGRVLPKASMLARMSYTQTPVVFPRSPLPRVKKHDVCLNTLGIEDAGRQSQNGVEITEFHQLPAQTSAYAIFEEDVVRDDHCSAATRF